MDPAVHPHPAQRVVDVGRVARQEDLALAELPCHPLVHLVQRAVRGLVRLGPRHQVLQPPLDRGVAQTFLVGLAGRRGEQHPPQRGHPQQHAPLVRVGAVVHVGQARQMVGELELGRHHEEALRVGVALELDVLAAPHGAPGAIGPDQMAGVDLVRLPVDGHGRTHAVTVLHHRLDAGLEVKTHVRHRVQLGLDQLRQLPLLALQPEGVVGVAGQQLHVELGDHALLAVPLLGVARDQALADQCVGQPVAGQHVERGRVKGGGAQVHAEMRGSFDHRHAHPFARQHERTDKAHRAGASNQDMCRVHPRSLEQ